MGLFSSPPPPASSWNPFSKPPPPPPSGRKSFHCDYLEDPELTNKTSGLIDSRKVWSARDYDYRIYSLLPLQEWRFTVI